jgi:hypothetical protein
VLVMVVQASTHVVRHRLYVVHSRTRLKAVEVVAAPFHHRLRQE